MTSISYEDRICCFIDILGFRDHIFNTLDGNNNDIRSKIDSIINIIKLTRDISDRGEDELTPSKMVTQFSDSLVISFKIEEPSEVFYSLMDLLHLSIDYILNGYLVRGGVSFGKLIHKEDMIFGPALISAYELEHRYACFPRILVDASVIAIGETYRMNPLNYERMYLQSLLKTDKDDRQYLDFIGAGIEEFDEPNYARLDYLGRIKEIVSNMKESSDPRVIQKAEWLIEKANEHIKLCKERVMDMEEIDGDVELAEIYKNLELFR